MVYLGVMVFAAAVGILILWQQQRKDRAHLETVEVFRTSLESLKRHTRPNSPVANRRPPTAPLTPSHLAPLDPKRRAAAKRRLDARKRASGDRIAS